MSLSFQLDSDPFRQFQNWFTQAQQSDIRQPNAMTLVTATPEGAPSARMVLLKGIDERGFRFYTNYEGRKAGELAVNPRAALLFYWEVLNRQVRIEGKVERLSAEESDAYFAARSRGSQIGAWASPQSREIPDRAWLEAEVARFEEKFTGVDPIPRPDFWGGYRVMPHAVEFWESGQYRLHDRFRYERTPGGDWSIARLAP